VRDAFNAVFVEADAAGQLMFYGKGAGGDPTASAVLGDVVAVARHRVGGGRGPGESAYADLPVFEMGQALTRYHISLDVADRPGVLAQVATSFAEHGVSIETVRQHIIAADPDGPDEESRETSANLIVVTHTAPDAALAATVQALGYAEADPTADVEGFDAAAKAASLASLAFHTRVSGADVHREGITEVTAADVASAREMGCVVKLLAIAERIGDGVSVRVHPAMIPDTHPLASVREAYNAVFVEAASAGQLMFYGRGAGGAPTASAVLGDLVAVARNALSGSRGAGESSYADLRILPMGEVTTRYHISLDVADKAGVLAEVANMFARHEVSIRTVRQEGHGDDAALVVVTHTATDKALQAVVDELRESDVVRDVASVMRVEGQA
jgi:ACT domain-containing protein